MNVNEVKQQLKEDLKKAIKEKDLTIKAAISVVSAKLNEGIKQAGLKGKEFTDEDVISIFSGELKQIKESFDGAVAGGRDALAKEAQVQMEFVKKYLPKQLTVAEAEEKIKDIIVNDLKLDLEGLTKKDMGKIMKEANAKLKGQIDGKSMSSIVFKFIK